MRTRKKKVLPLHQRRLRAILHLLVCIACVAIFWLLIGMPTPNAEHALRQLERKHFLEPGEILTTLSDDKFTYPIVRGTDGIVRAGRINRYDKLPILYESYSGMWMTCDNLDGMAYFPGNEQNETVYLVVADEQVTQIVMDIWFTAEGIQYQARMIGMRRENGVFALDLAGALGAVQPRDELRGHKQSWIANFPGDLGLEAFDAYDIRACDGDIEGSGTVLHRWTKEIG